MMKVYLDNAATTAIDPVVFEAMKPYLLEEFGNPSSIHSHGRRVRSAIERSRKTVAELLNTSPSEIFFTSGGTEADNMAIRCTIDDHGIKRVISSKIEHHAVSHTVEELAKEGKIKLDHVNLDGNGVIDMDHLESLLKSGEKTLVSIMHANNEIANINEIDKIGELCEEYGAIFHSDTVQTMGHFKHDLQSLKAHFIVGSAHKFHGPKGVGFLYLNNNLKINPYVTGGAQERNMRGGTENVYGIVGMAKALEITYSEMDEHATYIKSLKSRMITKLKELVPGVQFNGQSADVENSLYTVLSVCTPPSDSNDMMLFNLDINGISASGGSACSSGSDIGSHVLAELDRDPQRGAVRFSFSKFNTPEEIDYTVERLAEIVGETVS
jgi:cysteine desulfurase